MNFETVPIIAEATPLTANGCSGDVLTLLKRRYRTVGRYDKEQTSPLALLETWWLAPAPAQQASRNSTFAPIV